MNINGLEFDIVRQFGPFATIHDARSYINMAKFPFVMSYALEGSHKNHNLTMSDEVYRDVFLSWLDANSVSRIYHNIWITELKPKDHNDSSRNSTPDT